MTFSECPVNYESNFNESSFKVHQQPYPTPNSSIAHNVPEKSEVQVRLNSLEEEEFLK